MNFSRLILGLDLGVTSVGWALLTNTYDENNNLLQQEIIASGARIFPATTEAKTNEPKNHKRRNARGGRRVVGRRRERKNKLRKLLKSHNLLPKLNSKESEEYFHELGNPYKLRVSGLDEKLETFEIGRAIYHLEKRRGFKSNRKSGEADDTKGILGEIRELKEKLEEENYKTLGEFLNEQDKKRGRYISRKMIENEFEKLWAAQKEFYPEVLTDELKTKIKSTIFFQRPISSNRGLIGKCTFEMDKKRCDMARQPAQRIRFWQDINNLKLQDEDSIEWEFLSDEERQKLAEVLENKKQLEYKDLRKVLKINETVRINLEENDKKIKGNTTAYEMRKAIGKSWDKLGEEKQEKLVEEMFRIESPESLKNRLSEYWKFNDAQIEKLLKAPLEDKYSRLSLKAIRKVLPKMIEKGLRYDEAVTEIYGDHRKLFETNSSDELPEPPKDLRNPIVTKALHELRKVVNAIIREYGKPNEIRVELARDLKIGEKQKTKIIQQQNKNKKANEEAEEFYKEKFGVEKVSYDDKLKYRLWLEAGEHCPYTGDKIPPELLLTDKVDIEHIIPYSRCFDNSYMNKTICMSYFNRDTKKNKTPYEIFSGNEDKYFEVLKRVESMPWAKRRRFETKEVDFNEMVGRQLSDTRYISREARKYLLKLYENEQKVNVLPGQATAGLRHHWGMNAILSEGDVDLKNRDDHRHHAIDAIVVALTDKSLFQYISRLAKRNREHLRKNLKGIEMPWESFLDDVKESIENITVSHAPTRRVRGKLLKETAYGATNEDDVFVVRKGIDELTKAMIPKIVDETIREIIT
ncbi:MAG: type II CRISPR RNA-guided endonuclease Cas9, partial [Aridibacter sp.]